MSCNYNLKSISPHFICKSNSNFMSKFWCYFSFFKRLLTMKCKYSISLPINYFYKFHFFCCILYLAIYSSHIKLFFRFICVCCIHQNISNIFKFIHSKFITFIFSFNSIFYIIDCIIYS